MARVGKVVGLWQRMCMAMKRNRIWTCTLNWYYLVLHARWVLQVLIWKITSTWCCVDQVLGFVLRRSYAGCQNVCLMYCSRCQNFPSFFIAVVALSGECTDLHGRTIAPGLHYVPGPDTCTLCVCDNGSPKWCKAVLCSPPQVSTCFDAFFCLVVTWLDSQM